MEKTRARTVHYKRSHFATQLPVDYLYTPSHSWLAQIQAGVWRVGFTKFATRMLGEMVDHGFDTPGGAPVKPGHILGWVEGFKAISDLFCVGTGTFSGSNPLLAEKVSVIGKDPYRTGWLYEFSGQPDERCLDVEAYRTLLDKTIDRILSQQKGEEII